MNCAQCTNPVEREDSFETGRGRLCGHCFTEYAFEHYTPIKGEDLKRIRAMLEADTAGLLPQSILLGLIEEGYERIFSKGSKFDEEVQRLATNLQKLAGLAVCKNTMSVLEALEKLASEQKREVQDMMRRLTAL